MLTDLFYIAQTPISKQMTATFEALTSHCKATKITIDFKLKTPRFVVCILIDDFRIQLVGLKV